MSRCILEQLKFAFGSLSTQQNVTKILFWFAIEKKKYQRYLQANECLSVSAARGKLLPKDTAENVTKLMIYSGLQKQKKSSGLNHRQINAPVFLLRKVNFYLKTQ